VSPPQVPPGSVFVCRVTPAGPAYMSTSRGRTPGRSPIQTEAT
jgi:hypothetical protein